MDDSQSTSSFTLPDEIIDLDDYEHVGDDNMISNLPLLFAGGYPRSLNKVGVAQLEKFIPFMVQCSLGDIHLPVADDCKEPEWWPEDIPFTVPLQRPDNYTGKWLTTLKKIVAMCYKFHRSIFLLRFCDNLSGYQTESLRFINNYNHTTSLYDRSDSKLLVTFRNENMVSSVYAMKEKKRNEKKKHQILLLFTNDHVEHSNSIREIKNI